MLKKENNSENLIFMKSNSTEKLENFILAFGATRLLLQRAHDNGSLIEGLILYTSLTDGFCRICLILKEQINKKTSDINEKYIHQEDEQTNFSERTIYKKAFDNKIIGKDLFDELNALYNIRNKVIHRFFISEVEYSHLENVCTRYEKVYVELWQITYKLEADQIEKGIGMTRNGPKITEKDESEIHKKIKKKIKSGSEKNLAKTLNCVSVEEIVVFASRKGLLKKCICGHRKIEHINLKLINKSKAFNLGQCLEKCSAKGCKCVDYKPSIGDN
jgi:uncharacterized protein YutE (UPF0331/DUF86 family)